MDELAKGRAEQTSPEPVKPKAVSEPVVSPAAPEKDLYATYALDNEVPFLADHFGIKNLYKFDDLDYKQEIDSIDDYLLSEIKAQKLDNSTKAVVEKLEQMEKVAGIDPTLPVSLKVKLLAAHADYLKKLGEIRGENTNRPFRH